MDKKTELYLKRKGFQLAEERLALRDGFELRKPQYYRSAQLKNMRLHQIAKIARQINMLLEADRENIEFMLALDEWDELSRVISRLHYIGMSHKEGFIVDADSADIGIEALCATIDELYRIIGVTALPELLCIWEKTIDALADAGIVMNEHDCDGKAVVCSTTHEFSA